MYRAADARVKHRDAIEAKLYGRAMGLCPNSDRGPIHHRAPRCAEGHLFIAVIAHQLVRTVRYRLREKGLADTWTALRDRLATGCRAAGTFRCAGDRAPHLRKATAQEPHQKPVYDILGIDPDARGFVKKLI